MDSPNPSTYTGRVVGLTHLCRTIQLDHQGGLGGRCVSAPRETFRHLDHHASPSRVGTTINPGEMPAAGETALVQVSEEGRELRVHGWAYVPPAFALRTREALTQLTPRTRRGRYGHA